MDVKSAFLNGYISEEVYVKQPPGFVYHSPRSCNIFTQIYIDDIVFGSLNSVLCEEFALSMKGEFEMSMKGELTFFLGLQVKQSPKGIFISQTKYTKELIKKLGMDNAKSIGTPMNPTTMLDKNSNEKSVDKTMYRGMIGSLLYLTASRPDIMFSVCKYARFQ
ncbi:uncharacterized mitochondrial protein AtMg00810-like [Nicotiana sylvestris]|uniref:uncharacterized mitochondrial protein AtMg00810-like n=1 Tax=Nicotiana sylvestris TaxID=4096 RepID=UPI00388CA4F8